MSNLANHSGWPILHNNQTQLEILVFSASGLCALLSLVLTIVLIYRHLKNYYEPQAQKPIIRILLMVPVYSVASFLAILAAPYALYFNLVRDCYEAFVLYQFLCLLTQYYESEGGAFAYELVSMRDINTTTTNSVGDQLRQQFERRRFPLPFCCCYYTPGNTLFAWIRRLALQYVFLKLILSVVAIVLSLTGIYHNGSFNPRYGYFWITILLNISAAVALYMIILFYDLIARTIVVHKPLLKFIAIKVLIFFCFWQALAISILYYYRVLPAFFGLTNAQSADLIQNVFICGEMVGLAIFNFWAFSYRPYRMESDVHTRNRAGEYLVTDILNPIDVVIETKEAFTPVSKKHSHMS